MVGIGKNGLAGSASSEVGKGLQVHAVEWSSRANGPGRRAVIWFQGCTLACPGCFNPATHATSDGYMTYTGQLAADLGVRADQIEGISISGGEPFQQPDALLDLLQRLDGSGLSRLLFSGYGLAELLRQPLGAAILAHADVLIAGRYLARHQRGHALLGSANQRVHLLTNRYTLTDLIPVPRCEVILHTDGSYTVSGIGPFSIS